MLVRLLLFASAVAAGVGALAFHVWGAAIAAGILAVTLLPQVVVGLTAALKRESQPEPRLYLPVRLSRAQQLGAAMVVVGVPLTIWRVVEDGWVVSIAAVPLLILGAAWLVTVVRREGWSGKKDSGERQPGAERGRGPRP